MLSCKDLHDYNDVCLGSKKETGAQQNACLLIPVLTANLAVETLHHRTLAFKPIFHCLPDGAHVLATFQTIVMRARYHLPGLWATSLTLQQALCSLTSLLLLMLFSSACIAFPFEALSYIFHQGLAHVPFPSFSLPQLLLSGADPSTLSSHVTLHFH